MSGRLILAFFILQLVDASNASARRATVRANGEAIVVQGNAQRAEAQASAAVYRNAVEQVAASLGGPRPGADSIIDQLLYDRAGSFVKSSSLKQRRLRGVTLQLELLVEIEVDDIEQVLHDRQLRKRSTDRASLHGAEWVRGFCGGRRGQAVL